MTQPAEKSGRYTGWKMKTKASRQSAMIASTISRAVRRDMLGRAGASAHEAILAPS